MLFALFGDNYDKTGAGGGGFKSKRGPSSIYNDPHAYDPIITYNGVIKKPGGALVPCDGSIAYPVHPAGSEYQIYDYYYPYEKCPQPGWGGSKGAGAWNIAKGGMWPGTPYADWYTWP
jgi:hypothetical protein